MLSKFKLGLAIAVSALPLNMLRVLAYRGLGYDIKESRIGLGSIIAVDSASIHGARIGRLNQFIGPISIVVEPGVTIGNRNEFSCAPWVALPEYREAGFGRALRVGAGATITSRHFFDVSGTVELGERSWIAGTGSQFWTHGAGVREHGIRIGTDCYVGSAARFAPGASIGNNVLVALGSVVSGVVDASNAVIGGVPAKVLRAGYDWQSQTSKSPPAEPGVN